MTPALFRFDKKLVDTLDQLVKATGAPSRAVIIRRAIALLKVAQEAHLRGEKVLLRPATGQGMDRVIVLPG